VDTVLAVDIVLVVDTHQAGSGEGHIPAAGGCREEVSHMVLGREGIEPAGHRQDWDYL
jgi:hypothetical protein